jgi:Heterokaryon incompatibility protein (HET)
MVYLCDTDSLPEPASVLKYATLSHSWGGILAKKLVKESIHDFQRGIRVGDLPKTFREAIHVTRKLGVKYLWVDALCVIQDSEKDWLVESSKMGEIYLDSYINLAATASGDSRGGLLPDEQSPCF